MRTKHIGVFVFLALFVAMGVGIYWLSSQPTSVVQNALADHKNTTYTIHGLPVTLVGGVADVESVPGSASRTMTRYFGNELIKDVNQDGKDDITFILTQETGGSGTFYYVVTAVKTDSGYIGSDALFLGDRIAPQTTESGPERSVIVNYAERNPGEDFTIAPMLGKSILVLLNPDTMQLGEWVENFEGESNNAGNQGIAVGEPNPSTPPSESIPDEPKPQGVKGGCMVGGCSSQLCGEANDMDGLISTCEYRAQYACYQIATCERQTTGACGWTETSELTQCLHDTEDDPMMEVY
jgi:hypothetical protein